MEKKGKKKNVKTCLDDRRRWAEFVESFGTSRCEIASSGFGIHQHENTRHKEKKKVKKTRQVEKIFSLKFLNTYKDLKII